MSKSKLDDCTKEELQNLLDTSNSYKEVLDKLNLSSRRTVGKWCKKYNLPTKKSDIDSMSDEDWSSL